MATGLELITQAMFDIGVLDADEVPTAAEAAMCLKLANRMLDRWGTQRLTMYQVLRTVQALTASTPSYTIGTGGTINIARPSVIQDQTLIIDNTASTPQEIPLTLFTDDQWALLANKTLTAALSSGIYYDYAWTAGLARVYVWPIPNVSTTSLVLYTPVALTSIALATTYTFPPGYEEAIGANLAVRIAIPFGKPASGELVDLANESLADIKRNNFRLRDLSIDRALLPYGSWYDIRSDGTP